MTVKNSFSTIQKSFLRWLLTLLTILHVNQRGNVMWSQF